MNLADLSIRRPIFITCVVILMLAVGLLGMKKLGVDLFPDVTFPVVTVETTYKGAGPQEIETLISKPLEDEISTLGGLKRLTSVNQEGISQVIAEFTMETDVKYAEQEVLDRVGSAKRNLPKEIDEPVIRRVDPSDQPILILSLHADLPEGKLYDVADDLIRPRLEQVDQVGQVEIYGGRKREIHVSLDRTKLKSHELSATNVLNRLATAGENVPVGKTDKGDHQTVFRSLGEFKTIDEIKDTLVNFFGSDVPTKISDLGVIEDSLVDEKTRAFEDGKKSLFLYIYRQSGANTIQVVNDVKKQMEKLNLQMGAQPGAPQLKMIRDGADAIHQNVDDVNESIIFGVILAVIVVFFFLGNGRSTIITGLALPNSLIGAFILLWLAGFSINIMSLLALSLSVGLLVDDAIVVRENIFRHIEMGKDPIRAAKEGTDEVRLAVIATTLTVIAVFGPVGFLKGVVGQFFKQFGLTICFAMMISLFDALTIAPMLSAYFAGGLHKVHKDNLYERTVGAVLRKFDRFQSRLEVRYEKLIHWVLAHPLKTLAVSLLVFAGSISAIAFVPKTFLPAQDNGEFSVGLDLPPGTTLDQMNELGTKVDAIIRSHKEVAVSAMTVGNATGDPNYADIYVRLVPSKQRTMNTSAFKQILRDEFKPYANANPKVKDYDAVNGGLRPFTLNILGNNQEELDRVGKEVFEIVRKYPGLKDVDTNTRPGKPEFQVALDPRRAQTLGMSTRIMGDELRTQIEGNTGAKFRELGREYDILVRLQEDQRDLKKAYRETYVPNINNNLIWLPDVTTSKDTQGPATINRQDRSRLVQISADIAPGAGLGNIMTDVDNMFKTQVKLPPGLRYTFVGQAENFQELGENMVTALGLGIMFIYLVLSSLYESFITPFTIMLALPLAICGSFFALFIAHSTLDIFSMIGSIMLMGVATKNSILLVDYTNQLMAAGKSRADAIAEAGKTRLRPILMTTAALIAGTLPIALGLNEASKQRTSMGIAIIGGVISSTLLTLIVIPAAFTYIDRFRIWSGALLKKLFAPADSGDVHTPVAPSGAHTSPTQNSERVPAPLMEN
jgi:hydrophobic/amphiphilic exporter-1 (mainly G- bacteria), HAE1 family